LKAANKQIILATHSPEIVNEAENDEIVLINRSKRSARRVGDIDGLQEALFSIGSGQNIHLARLSRGRKVLFLEGDDYRLLKRFASRLGLNDLHNNVDITVIPIGGFGQRHRIEDVAWTFEKVLKADIATAAILDRDYRTDEEVEALIRAGRSAVQDFYILERKEIENYLLVPAAIERAVRERLKERENAGKPVEDISNNRIISILSELSDEMKLLVLSQRISNTMRFFANKTAQDPSTVAAETIAILDSKWSDLHTRLAILPGKKFLSSLNERLHRDLQIAVSSASIVRNMTIEEIGCDLRQILRNLNRFATDHLEEGRSA
jgi:predicted ATP-dependent endonuclease of OLD family